jgi:hypothetical protein
LFLALLHPSSITTPFFPPSLFNYLGVCFSFNLF